ncbi:hypothetical protein EYF80_048288 [Liparis tanakae]|uniref:Uncharacterized protein n=1 Tax=Liparis tanakae TaxID=230148 RepID=A0A4Z2FJY4_9TELE|nr:hypothetical protein EYF80_048288 [Liparis tanakae]
MSVSKSSSGHGFNRRASGEASVSSSHSQSIVSAHRPLLSPGTVLQNSGIGLERSLQTRNTPDTSWSNSSPELRLNGVDGETMATRAASYCRERTRCPKQA